MRRAYLATLLLWLSLSLLGAPANSIPRAEALGAIDGRFGAVEAFWAPNEAAALGIGWERILFYWNQLQPFGPDDWNSLHVRDEWLAEARSQGRTVVGLLKNTPEWATDGVFASGVPRGLFLPIDDPGNLWAAFTRRTASYYGDRGVHHWIIWNEPDIAPGTYGHEFSGSIEEYFQLLKVAYLSIKGVNPAATIHLGGLTYWHDPGYLRRFLHVAKADPEAVANNYFFDVISLHIYFRPETVSLIVGHAFSVQRELGIEPLKRVWINETNARPSMDPEWPVAVQAFHVDLEQQAWYLVQAYALGFYAGAARISVYKLIDINISPGDESWGLVRPYDFSKRPAYFAYQTSIKYLSGFTLPLQREQTAEYIIIAFPRPQGVTRVLWARNGAVSLSVPALAPAAMMVDPLTDTRTALASTEGVYEVSLQAARCHVECLIGGPPLFLVEEGVQLGTIPTISPILPPSLTPLPIPTESAALTASATPTESATLADGATPTATAVPSVTSQAASAATATTTPTPLATRTSTPEPTVTKAAMATPAETSRSTTESVSIASSNGTPTPQAISIPTLNGERVADRLPAAPESTHTTGNAVETVEDAQESNLALWFVAGGASLSLMLLMAVRLRRRRSGIA